MEIKNGSPGYIAAFLAGCALMWIFMVTENAPKSSAAELVAAFGAIAGAVATSVAAFFVREIARAEGRERMELQKTERIAAAAVIGPIFDIAAVWVDGTREAFGPDSKLTLDDAKITLQSLRALGAGNLKESGVLDVLPKVGGDLSLLVTMSHVAVVSQIAAIEDGIDRIEFRNSRVNGRWSDEANAAARRVVFEATASMTVIFTTAEQLWLLRFNPKLRRPWRRSGDLAAE